MFQDAKEATGGGTPVEVFTDVQPRIYAHNKAIKEKFDGDFTTIYNDLRDMALKREKVWGDMVDDADNG